MRFGLLFGVVGILAVAAFVLWIWALIDCLSVDDDSQYQSGSKLIWVLIIVLLHWVGALIYLAIGRPRAGAGPRVEPSPPKPAAGQASSPPLPPPPS
jgi:phospholipase D-like protein